MNNDVIIIGAGAAGLTAARELSKKGKKVKILEARDRIGGRIFTMSKGRFSRYIEAGAEFMHGKLPVTASLLKEKNIKYFSLEGDTYRFENGRLFKSEEFIEGFPLVVDKLKSLKKDISLKEFLNLYFSEEKYNTLKESVIRFAEGFDAANGDVVSSFSLRDEWSDEATMESFHIIGGYGRVISSLYDDCKANRTEIILSTVVKEIHWQPGVVEVICADGKRFNAAKVIVTIPAGVVKNKDSEGHIIFIPEIPNKIEAINQIGYGGVIKTFIQLNNYFWDKEIERKLENLGFLLSDQVIPTWWTQLPEKYNILTGWIGGPQSDKLSYLDNEFILGLAVESLSKILNLNSEYIKQNVIASEVINWNRDTFSCGAYSFATINTEKARKIISEPEQKTIYFAGEAYYSGNEGGTVEAALANGIETAKLI